MDFQDRALLIKNAFVYTSTYNEPKFKRKSILIQNGKVKQVWNGPITDDWNQKAIIWDASNTYLTPPFSNGHSHSYTGILKRTVGALPLDLYMLEAIAYGQNRSTSLIYDSTLLHGYELLRNGYQMTVDHFSERPSLSIEGLASAINAYRKLGLKSVLAPMFADKPYLATLPFSEMKEEIKDVANIKAYEKLISTLLKDFASEQNIAFALGVDGVQRCSDYLLERTSALMKDFNIGWHSHLLESHTQWTYSHLAGESLVKRIDRHGLLNEKSVFAHAIWTTESDRKRMADKGASIVHCTCSNLHLGSGICPIHRYQAYGIPWFLGTDGFNCGTLNAFELMRQAARTSRIASDDRLEWLRAEDVFKKMIKPTNLCKDDWNTEFLAEGQPASFLAFHYQDIEPAEFFDEVVYYENGENMRDIMMEGSWIKKEGIDFVYNEDIKCSATRLKELQLDYEIQLKEARINFGFVDNILSKSWEYALDYFPEQLPKLYKR